MSYTYDDTDPWGARHDAEVEAIEELDPAYVAHMQGECDSDDCIHCVAFDELIRHSKGG